MKRRRRPQELSPQQLLSCAPSLGCKGGSTCTVLYWLSITHKSLVRESQYPYEGKDSPCDEKKVGESGNGRNGGSMKVGSKGAGGKKKIGDVGGRNGEMTKMGDSGGEGNDGTRDVGSIGESDAGTMKLANAGANAAGGGTKTMEMAKGGAYGGGGEKVQRVCGCHSMVGREDLMLRVLAQKGPLAVNVDALSWHDYIGGVVQHHCTSRNMNHAVQVAFIVSCFLLSKGHFI